MTAFDARIEIVDDGFFYPSEAGGLDHVDGHRFHHLGVAGLSVSVQFVRTTVYLLPHGLPHPHLVIWANHPRVGDDPMAQTDRVLRSTFPDASVSFVRDVALLGGGDAHQAEVQAWSSDARTARESVSAIGAAQCFGTLADLEQVTVQLAGTTYSALLRHGSGAWLASVSTSFHTSQT